MSTKNGTTEKHIKIQVKSFCPFVESCPYISEAICADCLRYYIISEKMYKRVSMVNILG